MGSFKYCVPFGASKLILYGFSTDSLRICGRFTHNISLTPKTNQNRYHGLILEWGCLGHPL